jgi:hypothetical protein
MRADCRNAGVRRVGKDLFDQRGVQASPPAMRSAIGSSVFVHNIGPVLRNGRNGVVDYLSLTCTRAISLGSSVIQRRVAAKRIHLIATIGKVL